MGGKTLFRRTAPFNEKIDWRAENLLYEYRNDGLLSYKDLRCFKTESKTREMWKKIEDYNSKGLYNSQNGKDPANDRGDQRQSDITCKHSDK